MHNCPNYLKTVDHEIKRYFQIKQDIEKESDQFWARLEIILPGLKQDKKSRRDMEKATEEELVAVLRNLCGKVCFLTNFVF